MDWNVIRNALKIGNFTYEYNIVYCLDINNKHWPALCREAKNDRPGRFHSSFSRIFVSLIRQLDYSSVSTFHSKIKENLGQWVFSKKLRVKMYFLPDPQNHYFFSNSGKPIDKTYSSLRNSVQKNIRTVSKAFVLFGSANLISIE